MDYIIHEVARCRTRLSDFHFPSFVFGHGVLFFGGFQYPPVEGCSTANCDFGALPGGDAGPSTQTSSNSKKFSGTFFSSRISICFFVIDFVFLY